MDDYVLGLPGVERPKVCFLPTASGDADHYIVRFYRAFAASPLRGRNMLAIWRVHELDAILRECWARGIVLAGLSAGRCAGSRPGSRSRAGARSRSQASGCCQARCRCTGAHRGDAAVRRGGGAPAVPGGRDAERARAGRMGSERGLAALVGPCRGVPFPCRLGSRRPRTALRGGESPRRRSPQHHRGPHSRRWLSGMRPTRAARTAWAAKCRFWRQKSAHAPARREGTPRRPVHPALEAQSADVARAGRRRSGAPGVPRLA